MANFRYGLSYEVQKRRDEFYGDSFDDMVGKIISLEQDLEYEKERSQGFEEIISGLEADQ